MQTKFAAFMALVAAARAQQACSQTPEVHPALTWSKCAAGGSCTSVAGSVALDSNWRWTHTVQGSTNCYTGNSWNDTICAAGQGTACATQCCVEGADYSGTYGITTSGNELNLKFVTTHAYGKNIGSRVYLMESDTKYQMFTLLGNEFTFDVDVSNIGCGLNGALYFVSMDADGGLSKFSTNKAGAKYGTGYCDSQCPRDVKFIDGKANVDGWNPSENDSNGGVGTLGACCAEMDIWEANKISTAYTPHPCGNSAYHSCVGDSCGGTYSSDRYAGDCDPDGCDFNSYRQGDKTFYGPGSGFKLDSNKKLTIVTQFLKGSDGTLSEIKRFYVQNGVVVPNSESLIASNPGNSLTPEFCSAQKDAFGDTDIFGLRGGFAQTSKAVAAPMVLVLSLWDDHYANMLWLDSTYPVDAAGKPGAERGSCPTTSGVPAEVERDFPNSNVRFSNIKFGPINSTFAGTQQPPVGSSSVRVTTTAATTIRTSTSSARTTTTTAASTGPLANRFGQCGGQGWSGPKACVSPYTCTYVNDWYSQCL
ncbi:Exoglucanase 1 [Colletotrichum orbiculare MAFF 240422]|uniref:Glucanase n=1 Tax=Colletotrichum orbiculare (strain 104-T / ATCC 96160 / CBS 514.97 / LARS 414 / MAFF 240422) TaxID=1213857 RepID=N4V823_COLOR|nr:Exoglucanase 1 [Colletotrichum orbiculare MAFF 240422]